MKNNKKGSMLIPVLILLMLLATLGIVMLQAATSNINASVNDHDSRQAYYTAKSLCDNFVEEVLISESSTAHEKLMEQMKEWNVPYVNAYHAPVEVTGLPSEAGSTSVDVTLIKYVSGTPTTTQTVAVTGRATYNGYTRSVTRLVNINYTYSGGGDMAILMGGVNKAQIFWIQNKGQVYGNVYLANLESFQLGTGPGPAFGANIFGNVRVMADRVWLDRAQINSCEEAVFKTADYRQEGVSISGPMVDGAPTGSKLYLGGMPGASVLFGKGSGSFTGPLIDSNDFYLWDDTVTYFNVNEVNTPGYWNGSAVPSKDSASETDKEEQAKSRINKWFDPAFVQSLPTNQRLVDIDTTWPAINADTTPNITVTESCYLEAWSNQINSSHKITVNPNGGTVTIVGTRSKTSPHDSFTWDCPIEIVGPGTVNIYSCGTMELKPSFKVTRTEEAKDTAVNIIAAPHPTSATTLLVDIQGPSASTTQELAANLIAIGRDPGTYTDCGYIELKTGRVRGTLAAQRVTIEDATVTLYSDTNERITWNCIDGAFVWDNPDDYNKWLEYASEPQIDFYVKEYRRTIGEP